MTSASKFCGMPRFFPKNRFSSSSNGGVLFPFRPADLIGRCRRVAAEPGPRMLNDSRQEPDRPSGFEGSAAATFGLLSLNLGGDVFWSPPGFLRLGPARRPLAGATSSGRGRDAPAISADRRRAPHCSRVEVLAKGIGTSRFRVTAEAPSARARAAKPRLAIRNQPWVCARVFRPGTSGHRFVPGPPAGIGPPPSALFA